MKQLSKQAELTKLTEALINSEAGFHSGVKAVVGFVLSHGGEEYSTVQYGTEMTHVKLGDQIITMFQRHPEIDLFHCET